MAKYKLPNGVVVETSDENASNIFGATSVSGGAKKAPAKKTTSKPDTKTDSE